MSERSESDVDALIVAVKAEREARKAMAFGYGSQADLYVASGIVGEILERMGE